MKLILLFTFCSVYTAIAVPVDNGYKHDHILPKTINLPDDEGNIHHVVLSDSFNIEAFDEIDISRHYLVEYYLYTRSNPTASQQLFILDEESIKTSYFNPSNPTMVIAHGFLGSQNSAINPTIRDAYLAKSDANIIALNWQRIGSNEEESAIRDTPALGRLVGQFLRYLSGISGASYGNMHLVGFSLGAHVIANAGKELNGQIARITGLDPAGSFWQYHPYRLRASDAIYVEGIHTDEESGIQSRVGDVDFYVNGGLSQPGCITSICSHYRSWQIFAATITYNHLEGRGCTTHLQVTSNLCFGDRLKMGNEELSKQGSGMYRVNTSWRYPY